MCGIAGIVSASQRNWKPVISRMTQQLSHRGPDESHVWGDPTGRVWLGHRRLSILDLSPMGSQPMLSRSGRYAISLNGEIYNYPELRKELLERGVQFRGHSDTEVLLEGFSEFGVHALLPRINGMFAFALWDLNERRFFLARDMFGEKPLYYGEIGGDLVFASELKAIREYPGFSPEVDQEALSLFIRLGYVPCPQSIYRGIRKLPPGCFLEISFNRDSKIEPKSYFQPSEVDQVTNEDLKTVESAETILTQAVQSRLFADVPVGAFLSGGIDSSLIVSLMKNVSNQPVKTFTIGFDEKEFDEAPYSRAVAHHLRTDHTELYVRSSEAQAVIPILPTLYDEPFADSSQIPTYLVSKLAASHVKVVLTGDAGDELFGGYNRYLLGKKVWSVLNRYPRWGTKIVANFLRAVRPTREIQKLCDILDATSESDLYRRIVSQIQEPNQFITQRADSTLGLQRMEDLRGDFTAKMMYMDLITYLPDDILVKMDRASMAVGLEARVPFLDPKVVDFARSLPFSCKVRSGESKWILRQVLYRHVPKELIERPKKGFGIPLDRWLRGPLKAWGESVLDPAKIAQEGLLKAAPIQKLWGEHQAGRANRQYALWNLISFTLWKRYWIP